MGAMLLLMFAAGVIIAIILPTAIPRQQPETRFSSPEQDSQLDTVDEMVLFGEVTNDEFYGIM